MIQVRMQTPTVSKTERKKDVSKTNRNINTEHTNSLVPPRPKTYVLYITATIFRVKEKYLCIEV